MRVICHASKQTKTRTVHLKNTTYKSIQTFRIFSTVSNSHDNLYRSGSLWVDEFRMIELDEIMGQGGDSAFCELLCRVGTADCTNDDLSVLKSREIVQDSPNYPNHALHVYRLNVDVDTRNNFMLNALDPENEQ